MPDAVDLSERLRSSHLGILSLDMFIVIVFKIKPGMQCSLTWGCSSVDHFHLAHYCCESLPLVDESIGV